MDVDPARFRQLLGRFATGVAVVTVVGPDDRPHGMTVNSLASVSLRPPLVLICVDRQADMHQLLLSAPEFVVNILAADQEALSRRFADPLEDRFEGVGYQLTRENRVVLDGVLAHLECQRHTTYPAGDHTIVIGRVVGGDTADGRPLLYYRGGYAAVE